MRKNLRQPITAWRAMSIFLLALLPALAWTVFDTVFSPRGEPSVTVEIPDLCGMNESELPSHDWLELRTEYRYDTYQPPGTVLAQSPPAGSRRKLRAHQPTCTLTLTVSLGHETVTLPALIGADVRDATSTLRALGLSVKTVERTGAYPAGTVISVEPSAHTTLPKGSAVTLTVCTGTPSKTVTVPDLYGLSRSDALVLLWTSQLGVMDVIEEDSDLPEGTVIRQSHRPGTTVIANTRVTVTVSRQKSETVKNGGIP